MIKKTYLGAMIALAASAALAGCKPPEAAKPASVDTTKIADAVKADFINMVAAFNAHDAAQTVSHDAGDFVGMFHGTATIQSPVDDMAMVTRQTKNPKDAHIAVSNVSVDVPASGEMAVVHASYRYTGTDPKTKKAVEEEGNWAIGYKLVDGVWRQRWRMAADVGTGLGVLPGIEVEADQDDGG